MDEAAERYVKLVLALGEHDPHTVDAYYGPERWREEVRAEALPLPEVRRRGEALLAGLRAMPAVEGEAALRRGVLARSLEALLARASVVAGDRLPFDDEAQALFDATPPRRPESRFAEIVSEVDRALAEQGFREGSLVERYEAFRDELVIPPDRLDAVFQAAITECRRRTAAHVDLPAEESFRVEYVTDQPWSGYNWYQGGYRSVIQVNTDLPITIDRAIDLACHEGYPGHHVYNVLLEKHLVREKGWAEASIYPLFSPQSLIAEGSANYGIDLAFPGDERVAWEREHLFPLAGIDPGRAGAYYAIEELKRELSYAGNEAARRYLDGEIDAAAAADWLVRYALYPRDRAEQRVRFMDRYRSYVINYNLGRDLVAAHVEAGGASDATRWSRFLDLLSRPILPSDLDGSAAPPSP